MRRQERRLMHYSATSLFDGTILAAYPVRKPIPKIKAERLRIDEDGVCGEWPDAGKELSDVHNESRMRFQDIIATRINTRRAIREIVCPYLIKLQERVDDLNNKLDHIQRLIEDQAGKAPL